MLEVANSNKQVKKIHERQKSGRNLFSRKMGVNVGKLPFTPVWNTQSKQNLNDVGMFNMIIQRKVFSASH